MLGIIDAEELARRFHRHYERLAPAFGYATRADSSVPWDDVPAQNRALMVATAEAVLHDMARERPDASRSTGAFAGGGHAGWQGGRR